MKKNYLLAPGPTPVPENILLDMAKPAIHHRTPQFSKIFSDAKEGLRYLFQTKNDVLILAASGTGAMEGSVVNLFSKGDNVLVINGGKFGERWGQICESYGINVTWIKLEWGTAVDPAKVKEALDADSSIKGVFVQASETSTTVRHPVKELAALTATRDNTLLVVDGITGVGIFDLPMDKWGIDVLVSGSQKALMLPPGLAFACLSDKSWKFAETADLPKYYFDFKKERKNMAKDTTAYTPATSLIIGLRTVLAGIQEEGLEKIYARHSLLTEAVRSAATALGLRLLAKDAPSMCATGVYLPEDVDGGEFVKLLRDELGVTIAGGQDHLKGKIFRISHMGYVGPFDILIALSAVEIGLKRLGSPVELGKGVAAAQKVLLEGYETLFGGEKDV